MLRLHRDNSLNDVIIELGTTQFVPTSAAEYAGNERLLRGVFGYKALPSKAPPPPTTAPPGAPGTTPAKPTGLQIEATRGG